MSDDEFLFFSSDRVVLQLRFAIFRFCKCRPCCFRFRHFGGDPSIKDAVHDHIGKEKNQKNPGGSKEDRTAFGEYITDGGEEQK